MIRLAHKKLAENCGMFVYYFSIINTFVSSFLVEMKNIIKIRKKKSSRYVFVDDGKP